MWRTQNSATILPQHTAQMPEPTTEDSSILLAPSATCKKKANVPFGRERHIHHDRSVLRSKSTLRDYPALNNERTVSLSAQWYLWEIILLEQLYPAKRAIRQDDDFIDIGGSPLFDDALKPWQVLDLLNRRNLHSTCSCSDRDKNGKYSHIDTRCGEPKPTTKSNDRSYHHAVHQRIGEAAQVSGGHPGLGIHQNGGVQSDVVGILLNELLPPGLLTLFSAPRPGGRSPRCWQGPRRSRCRRR